MKPEKTKVEAAPTMPDVVKEKSEVAAKVQTDLLAVFLKEHCEIMGIKECELKDILVIRTLETTCQIVNVDDERDVKIGVTVHPNYDGSKITYLYEVYGEFILMKDSYPKTTKFLESINPKK